MLSMRMMRPGSLCVLLVGCMLALAVAVSRAAAAGYSMEITFTNFAGHGTLTNFPALIKLTTNNTENYTGFLDTTNGWDLRFWTNSSLSGTELNYEIELFSSASFVPTDISGCALWLDAGAGIMTNGSGAVIR